MWKKTQFRWWVVLLLLGVGCQATAISALSFQDETVGCKQIIFSYAVLGRNGFEENVVSSCPDGTEKMRLTLDGQGNGGPVWSPNGKEIAFFSGLSGLRQLHIMDGDGGNVRQITSDLDIAEFGWLPDDQIALKVLSGDGSWIWQAADVHSGDFLPLQLDPTLLHPRLSHDGDRVAYVTVVQPPDQEIPSQILMQDVDGTNRYTLTDDTWTNTNPVWSADDSQIAFLSNRDSAGDRFAIYVADADGRNMQQVTEAIFGRGSHFAWSPDGSSVVIFSSGAIYVLDLNSGEMLTLFTVDYPNTVSGFSWQP